MTDDLKAWFAERPKWLQEAARLLLTRHRLADEDLDAVLAICLREGRAEDTTEVAAFPSEAFSCHDATEIRLCSIENVKGINALAPRNPLDFGPHNMVIVYGGNGSGKSGYVRILKHLCGARNPGTLHPNVFADDGAQQSADIKYKRDDQERMLSWTCNDGVHADLRAVDIFDTECGKLYLESESEVAYEPPALLFFSELIAVCEQLSRRIDGRLSELTSKKPEMPAELADTVAGRWYSSLSARTPPEEISRHTKWSNEDHLSLADLDKRLAEKAPADRARELLTKKQHAVNLISWIEAIVSKLSDDCCRRFLKLRMDSLTKREAAQAAASKLFSEVPLEGIGTDAWRHLWEYARQYSEKYAYQDKPFPQLAQDARCVLCHQPLSDDARLRFSSFEDFVKGHAEKDAKSSEKAFEDAIVAIGDIPTAPEIKTQCDAAGVTYEGEVPALVTLVEALRQRKAKLLDADSEGDLPAIPDFTAWREDISRKVSECASAAARYQEDAASDSRPQLQSQLCGLKARKWLTEQHDAVVTEIERLQAVEHLIKAKRLTDTRVLSRKKGELANSLITEAFVQRFCDELKELGAARIKVELVKTRVDRGHVLHELRLANARSGAPRDVLSEGEHRVVSLAAFLADVTGKQYAAPFVFDDPISSLDQDFEEAVVRRLVCLARGRQVIVFTHRISLLVLLQDRCKCEELDLKVTCIRSENWGTGEPGATPPYAKAPDKALNALINERLPKARRASKEEGQASYEPLAKSICSDFRILLERMIETQLLAGVVERFRRAVKTQTIIKKLARITDEDCKLFEDLMTKYSCHEHSQPYEAPVAVPTPEDLEADMEGLREWHRAFAARTS